MASGWTRRWRRLRGRVRRPADPVRARHRLALAVASEVERAEPALPRSHLPRLFRADGTVVRRGTLDTRHASLLPGGDRGEAAAAPAAQHRARVAADALVLAKFDLGRVVKFRAVYPAQDLTLAVRGALSGGARRSVKAHEVVSVVDPDLIPPLVAHGTVGRHEYLVERWVDGTPLSGRQALADVVPELAARLRRVHESFGVSASDIATWRQGSFAQRWAAVSATELLPDDLAEPVRRLLADPHQAWSVSWCHGDLAASNILSTPTGHVLVDWETSGAAPVMLDAAKLHLFSTDPERTARDLLAAWPPGPPGAASPPREQLVLAHAWFISAYPARRLKLRGHPREQIYEGQVRRQVELVRQLLAGD
ncbi:phosphotransferase [Serinicoccus kebangsaanensis]|uniref:phosphotransferase n=1 Tax=Serinicoccus kebangsaanensis TaxID=2602069 RepID=UPI00192DF843|nr:phosphotransferase [Serinicoccus kebangsaanensis]